MKRLDRILNNQENIARDHGRMFRSRHTFAELDALYANHKGLCDICGTTDVKKFHLDHDHATGKLRGLLCHGCNVGLGMFGDDVERLLAAIEYLKTHRDA